MLDYAALAAGDLMEQVGIYALPLIGSTMLAYAIFNLVGDLRKKDTRKITDRLKDRGSLGGSQERMVKESIRRQSNKPNSGIGALITNLQFASKLQRMLDQANVQWSAAALLVNIVGLSAFAFIACYFLELPLWVSITAAVALLILPLVAISVKRNMRMNKFMYQLPDVFELMSQALRAGHSLPNAILLISEQVSDPVGTEFGRVFHEQNLGIKMDDALKGMADRIGLMDVKFFVTAVLIQRATGGDLAEVLDNISGVIRGRIKLFGTVRALTAEGRLSGWVLLALPIIVFVLELVVNPEYAQVLLDEPLGQYMLIGAGVAQLLGLIMIKKIVNIKV